MTITQEYAKLFYTGKKPLSMSNSQFTFPRLFMDMQQHQGSMLMIYDQIASPYEQVEKTTQNADLKTFLALQVGDEGTRATKTKEVNTSWQLFQ